jgi:tetratricopeptide (TPR) repeat protein
VAIARRLVKADPQDRTAQYDLANSLLRQGAAEVPGADRAESLAALRESSAILESLAREEPSAIRYQRPLALVHQYAGICLREMGRLDEAMAELRRSMEIADAMMAVHPGDASALSRLVRNERDMAAILASRGDSAAALSHAQRGLYVARRYVDGPEPGLRKRFLADAYFGLASIDRTFHKWQEARDNAQQAIANWDQSDVKDSDPGNREQAAAIVAESAAQLQRAALHSK